MMPLLQMNTSDEYANFTQPEDLVKSDSPLLSSLVQKQTSVPLGFPGALPLVERFVDGAGISDFAPGECIQIDDDERHHLLYTVMGRAMVSWEDHISELEKNTMWTAPARIEYRLVAGDYGWKVMWYSLRNVPIWKEMDSRSPHFRYPGQAARMTHVLEGLIFEANRFAPQHIDMAHHLAAVLAIFLDRRLSRSGEQEQGESRWRLSVLWRTVDETLQRSWSIEAMAAEVAFSPSQLYKIVREIHDDTPLGVLTALRMRKAKMLLDYRPDTLESIGLAVGYSSAYSFSKAFKRSVGVSPKEYRKQQRSRSGRGASITDKAAY